MMVCALHVPIPPSLNNAFFNRPHGGRAKTTAYKNWLDEAAWTIRSQRPPLFIGPVQLDILIERPNKQSDLDNRLKGLLDAIQKAGVVKNDNQIVDIRARWAKVSGAAITILSSVEEEVAA